MNTLPRKKIHVDGAAKSAAYRRNQRALRQGAAAIVKQVVSNPDADKKPLLEVWEELSEEQRDALRRLATSQELTASSQNAAG
jgi:hypothetical protein